MLEKYNDIIFLIIKNINKSLKINHLLIFLIIKILIKNGY